MADTINTSGEMLSSALQAQLIAQNPVPDSSARSLASRSFIKKWWFWVACGAIILLIWGIIMWIVFFMPKPETSMTRKAPIDSTTLPADATPLNETFSTVDLKIKITGYRIFQAGQGPNKDDTSPAIEFYYDVTNVSGARNVIAENTFGMYLEPYQGKDLYNSWQSDPTAGFLLQAFGFSDNAESDKQSSYINKGGTVSSSTAYALDDLTSQVIIADSIIPPLECTHVVKIDLPKK